MWRIIITIQDKILVAAISLELLMQEDTRIYRQSPQGCSPAAQSPFSVAQDHIPHCSRFHNFRRHMFDL